MSYIDFYIDLIVRVCIALLPPHVLSVSVNILESMLSAKQQNMTELQLVMSR